MTHIFSDDTNSNLEVVPKFSTAGAINRIPTRKVKAVAPTQLSIDGLETVSASQVTHQGGRGEPFHDWYP